MKPQFEKILKLALPYLDTRENLVHTRISVGYAYRLLESEGGNEDIVTPAVILHDTGWKMIPEALHVKAFGPAATRPDINRRHELEGAGIARRILEEVSYDPSRRDEIVRIVEGHDSRPQALSLNDMIVKDADKLWRYSGEGLRIDTERFKETPLDGIERLKTHIEAWFFTESARQMAVEEISIRQSELKV